ncbi:uncharacterized protein EV422DRAFT_347010 [Fimicolochytrium jonesii]|uniref:uncharacterized protein n=1 Tax=Fimicolochytrium jonesii TaxID=1396493 RepID=UPI0022FDD1D5|nr:uncharacterized protein EV422DRAFT_347010 [Fimicolochytrium jonesii]KAI8815652.1 hypothetical protein EV422DRAFT_347010 [Fimicolochytrium jonesii]
MSTPSTTPSPYTLTSSGLPQCRCVRSSTFADCHPNSTEFGVPLADGKCRLGPPSTYSLHDGQPETAARTLAIQLAINAHYSLLSRAYLMHTREKPTARRESGFQIHPLTWPSRRIDAHPHFSLPFLLCTNSNSHPPLKRKARNPHSSGLWSLDLAGEVWNKGLDQRCCVATTERRAESRNYWNRPMSDVRPLFTNPARFTTIDCFPAERHEKLRMGPRETKASWLYASCVSFF